MFNSRFAASAGDSFSASSPERIFRAAEGKEAEGAKLPPDETDAAGVVAAAESVEGGAEETGLARDDVGAALTREFTLGVGAAGEAGGGEPVSDVTDDAILCN